MEPQTQPQPTPSDDEILAGIERATADKDDAELRGALHEFISGLGAAVHNYSVKFRDEHPEIPEYMLMRAVAMYHIASVEAAMQIGLTDVAEVFLMFATGMQGEKQEEHNDG